MFESGKFDDMLNYCTKLLEINPDDMVALQNSALALLHLEKFEDSFRKKENFSGFSCNI